MIIVSIFLGLMIIAFILGVVFSKKEDTNSILDQTQIDFETKIRKSNKMKFILGALILVCIGYVFFQPKVVVEYSSGYSNYISSINRALNFTPGLEIEGDTVHLKVNDKNKLISISYDLWKDDKLVKTGTLVERTVVESFEGDINVLLLFNRENEKENLKLFTEVQSIPGGSGGEGHYINLPNFLYQSNKTCISYEQKKVIPFNEEIVIYNIAADRDDPSILFENTKQNKTSPVWKLEVKLIVKELTKEDSK